MKNIFDLSTFADSCWFVCLSHDVIRAHRYCETRRVIVGSHLDLRRSNLSLFTKTLTNFRGVDRMTGVIDKCWKRRGLNHDSSPFLILLFFFLLFFIFIFKFKFWGICIFFLIIILASKYRKYCIRIGGGPSVWVRVQLHSFFIRQKTNINDRPHFFRNQQFQDLFSYFITFF